MAEDATIVSSTGSVFADLDLPGADDRLAKAELGRQIGAIIRERGLTQKSAAEVLGIDQPKVSALLAGQLAGLTLLGRDVQIVVRETSPSNRTGRLSVITA
jgi:predicted XRE-type DNA-binding protein